MVGPLCVLVIHSSTPGGGIQASPPSDISLTPPPSSCSQTTQIQQLPQSRHFLLPFNGASPETRNSLSGAYYRSGVDVEIQNMSNYFLQVYSGATAPQEQTAGFAPLRTSLTFSPET